MLHPPSIPMDDFPPIDLDALVRKAQRRVAAPPPARASAPAPVIYEHTPTAYLALVAEQSCDCGAISRVVEGFFLAKANRRSHSEIWSRIDPAAMRGDLPRQVRLSRSAVTICAACLSGAGFHEQEGPSGQTAQSNPYRADPHNPPAGDSGPPEALDLLPPELEGDEEGSFE